METEKTEKNGEGKKTIWQFIKFAVVGVSNTLVDWAIFYLLIATVLPNEKLTAKAISFIVAAVNSFVWNSVWTFRKEFLAGISDKTLRFYRITNYFIRFFVVSLVGFVINYFTFSWALNKLGAISHSNLISLVLASGAAIVWNFIINKLWTYRKDKIDGMNSADRAKKLRAFKFDIAAGAILAVMMLISFMTMRGDSAIVDEVAHIPSGYSYIEYHDYRLNPEHPPFAKALAGISLSFQKFNGFENNIYYKSADQWDSGWDFLYRLGNNPDTILFWARLPMLLFALGLGVILYKWAAELFGNKTALFVTFLYAMTPDFLAHSHLVTTDVPAALGFLLAVYTFDKFLQKGGRKYFILAILGFAAAQLLKFSAVLLYGIFPILVFARADFDKKSAGAKYWSAFWRRFKSFFSVSVGSLAVVWLVYIPLIWSTPVSIEKQVILNNLTSDPRTEILRTFLDKLAGNHITMALGQYLLGVMLVFARVVGGNSTFIIGHFSDKAISWFFPVAFLIKTPMTIIVLAFFALVYMIWKSKKNLPAENWFLWLMLAPFLVYWVVALRSSLDLGTRYLLPTLPFLYLLIGFATKNIIESKKFWAKVAVVVAIFTLAAPVLAAYPKYLGYLNIATFGHPGYQEMVDSGLDWGQDLKRLQTYAQENQIKNMKIDYFGGGLPSYYIPDSILWRSGYGPTTGWLVVSATYYQMSKLQGKESGKWSYDWLESYNPVTVIGTSILVFHITPADLATNPPKSPYPITNYDVMPAAVNGQL
ncbi:MAG: GtrA family protein [Candidatus Berkelbacteria bacterium]|nr:GtrA family protein [Candidatus Berkelbacteria bacterium]